jgi:hypothetical protein
LCYGRTGACRQRARSSLATRVLSRPHPPWCSTLNLGAVELEQHPAEPAAVVPMNGGDHSTTFATSEHRKGEAMVTPLRKEIRKVQWCSTSRKKSKILGAIELDFERKRSVTDSAGAAALRDLSPAGPCV